MSEVAELLWTGFRRHSRAYWLRALDRLAGHPTPAGLPKYGYLLEREHVAVGAVLLISSIIRQGDISTIRCNVSSWYVEASYRSHAALLVAQAIKHKNVTYIDVYPAAHVVPIVEAFGFVRYVSGQFVTAAVLCRGPGEARVTAVKADSHRDMRLQSYEWNLLEAHSRAGCISLLCQTPGDTHPFVFLPKVVKGWIRCAQLIYCRDLNDFVRLARPVGWFLALRGSPLISVDANGPIRGLVGKYFDGIAPKYFKGPVQPRLGDLAFTDSALFGA